MDVKNLLGGRVTERLRREHALAIPPPWERRGRISMSISNLRNGKMIIKVSEVKEVAGGGFRISEEFYRELDREVHEMIEGAARRAKKNGRKTLKPYDL
jgi:hypothetical protein